jgi:hypothetical protein
MENEEYKNDLKKAIEYERAMESRVRSNNLGMADYYAKKLNELSKKWGYEFWMKGQGGTNGNK